MNPSIFKTYDIRGIYPDEINEEAVEKIAAAQFEFLKPKTIVVGYDSRITSPNFAKIARKILSSLGAKVFDIGMVPIELWYFSCGHLDADAGFMVTASHNPREYNGIKMIIKGARSLTSINGLEDIKNIALKEIRHPLISSTDGTLMGNRDQNNLVAKIEKVDLWDKYISKVLSTIDKSKIKPIKIICDASNGVAGLALKRIEKHLPVKIIELNFQPDGNFPNHEPNPLISFNREQAINECRNNQDVSLAAIFDGDADRVAFLTEDGKFIDTDFISALITKILLNKHPGEPIVFDLRRGWAIKDQAEILGSKFYPAKSGYPFIKEKMRTVKAIFGGEASAHYFYRDFFYSDSSIITLLLVLEFLSENNLTISQAIEEYLEGYFMYEESNFKVKNIDNVFNILKEEFSDGKINTLDGLSVDYDDWHFNVRSSATQPLIRLNIEGKNPEIIETKRDKIVKIIEDLGGILVEE